MACIRDGTASLECPDRPTILVRPAIAGAIGRLVAPSFRAVVAHPPKALLDVLPVGVDVLLDYAQEDRVLRLLVRQGQGAEVVAEGLDILTVTAASLGPRGDLYGSCGTRTSWP
jgi:hypothetical protein